jgi:hypothetical protein
MMTITATVALLAMVGPLWASSPGLGGNGTAGNATATGTAAAADTAAAVAVVAPMERPVHVQVTTRVMVVDRAEATRVGLGYVVLGHDRVRVGNVLGATAFLDLVRQRRLVRSESTQQVMVLSGGEARVASHELSVGRNMTRTRGPSLTVVPTVGADGMVHLWVRAGLDDVVGYGWGYEVDGSPASVDTEIVARPGEDVILASGAVMESTSEGGLLRWGGATRDRDVLIVLRVELGR